ncbi:MAG TPA: hypothetical protein VF591_08420 [Pyrinomonadaceae bacterium]|jgi:putative peptide zinc metalloprotease protein
MSLSLNPSLYVHPLDAATDQAMVICEVQQKDNAARRYALPSELLDLLRLFDGRRETAEVVAAYNGLHGQKYSRERVEQLIGAYLLPRGLLVDAAADPAALPEQSSKRVPYLYARVRLLRPRVIYPVARALGWPFSRPALFASSLVFIALHLVFYIWVFPRHPVNLAEVTTAQFFAVGVATIIAALIHETGHASALVSYGCKQAEIGLGLYIYFPVLYTDVSEAWKLNRRQRAMVDIAGVYFQSVCFPVLLCLFWLTGSPAALYTFILIDVAIVRTLNPFLRMDGYWLMADLFGIFNLRQQSVKLLKFYLLKLIPGRRKAVAPPLKLSRGARAALSLYTVLCTAFFLYFFVLIFYQLAYFLIPNYPQRLLDLWQVSRESPFSLSKFLSLLLETAWRSVILLGISLFTYRTARGAWGFLKEVARSVVGRPLRNYRLHEGVAERY